VTVALSKRACGGVCRPQMFREGSLFKSLQENYVSKEQKEEGYFVQAVKD